MTKISNNSVVNLEKFNVLIVGTGNMGRNHIKTLLNYNMVENLYVTDINNVDIYPYNYSSKVVEIDDLMATTRLSIDYAVIATPISTHLQIARQLSRYVKYILVEKPLAVNSLEAHQFLELNQIYNTNFIIGFIERFNPSIIEAKKVIDEGGLGDLISINTTRQGPRPSSFKDSGVILELASHDIDLVRYLTKSEYKILDFQVSYPLGKKYEDFLAACGRLENEIIVSHQVDWVSPFKERKIRVFGSSGTLEIDMLSMEVTFNANGNSRISFAELSHIQGTYLGQKTSLAFDKFEPLWREHLRVQNLCRNIADEVQFAELRDGIETSKVLDKLLRLSKRDA